LNNTFNAAPSKMFLEAFLAEPVATSSQNRLLKRQLTYQTEILIFNCSHKVLVETQRLPIT